MTRNEEKKLEKQNPHRGTVHNDVTINACSLNPRKTVCFVVPRPSRLPEANQGKHKRSMDQKTY